MKLHAGTDPIGFEHKIEDLVIENNPVVGEGEVLFLQPYEKLQLYSNFENGKNTGDRIIYVRIFSLVAILVLLIACINFMNLSTAQSSQRAREIGIRKAVGAIRGSLVLQFIGEAVMMAFLALLLALAMIYGLLPAFNNLTEKTVAIDFTLPTYWLLSLGLVVLIGLLAGSYPALFLSSLNTIRALERNQAVHFGAINLRKALVVFQFTLSILMMLGTQIVHQQVQYIQHKDLGLNRDNLIYMPLGNAQAHYEVVRNQLLQHPSIVNVTSTNQNPLGVVNSTSGVNWDGKGDGDGTIFYFISTELDYLKTMQMELKEGRDFSMQFSTDTTNFIVNETAARAMGMDHPVGETLGFLGQKGKIIGEIKDFHLQSMHVPIAPLILRYDPKRARRLFVRAKAEETQQAMAALEDIQHQYNPEYPFEYHFMDEEFARMYQSEMVMGRLTNYFAILAMVIACLGLFGLASYAAARRTKEIGKGMGASETSIVVLLSGSFANLVLMGFVIAAPLAYYLMHQWLNNFAYHVRITWWVFILAGVASLLIALITISYRSLRAAQTNPVEALRYE